MGLQRKIQLLFLLLLFCTAVQAQTTVYITNTGEKYHKQTCKYLSKSSISIELTKAKENGYTACSVCKPGGTTTTTQPVKQNASVSRQCSAMTKAGSRCKGVTTNASGRCYQH
ncbi:MAG: hypothetical protein KF803_10840 [Cyclobacteriaceae bacterium]|nr:hypothetical protein [Cyclobacteriaceae bacterium]